MNIKSYEQLKKFERRVIQLIPRYPLDALLIGIRESNNRFEPFVMAGICLFAIRCCAPGPKIEKVQTIRQRDLEKIAHLITQYLIADPVVFDKTEKEKFHSSNPVYRVLRLIGNQFPYSVNLFGQHAQPYMLFHKIPNILKEDCSEYTMDIESAFYNLSAFSISDFIDVCFITHSVALKNNYFTRAYLEKSREHMNVPDEFTFTKVMNSITGDPLKLTAYYTKFRNKNRKYRMYDFNPLFLYPIIRPWKHDNSISYTKDRMIAPTPELIAYRMSTGVYYQLFNEYKTSFSDSFGLVFEHYIGWLLKESYPEQNIWTEKALRKIYPDELGQISDFVVLESESVVLIECKATKFTRAALVTGEEHYVDDSLKQVIKGLIQLAKFKKAFINGYPSLQAFHKFKKITPILITLEPLYMINSELFRSVIDTELSKEGISAFDWTILSLKELEALQPFIKGGITLNEVTDRLKNNSLNDVLSKLNEDSHKSYVDSCLYQIQEEMYERIGI